MPPSIRPRSASGDRTASTRTHTGEEVRGWHLVHRDGTVSSAVVVPSWGANVIASSVQHSDLAWPTPLLESVDFATVALKPTSYGLPILSPTPGGVGQNQNGLFDYKGRRYRIAPRHGFLRNRAWEVDEATPTSITCRLSVRPDSLSNEDAFPFEFDARYDVQLTARGLQCSLRLKNPSNRAQPLDVGWHPYLHRSGDCRVHIPADSRWELNGEAEPTPTGKIVAVGDKDDFRSGRPLTGGEHWDETFTGLPGGSGQLSTWMEETVPARTRSGSIVQATVRRSVIFTAHASEGALRPMRHVQLYTPPSRQAICLEPLSAPPDAINLLSRQHAGADVCELPPGEHVLFEAELALDISLS